MRPHIGHISNEHNLYIASPSTPWLDPRWFLDHPIFTRALAGELAATALFWWIP